MSSTNLCMFSCSPLFIHSHVKFPQLRKGCKSDSWCNELLSRYEGRILVLTYKSPDTFYNWYIKKVKCSRYRPGVAQRLGRGIALLFHDRGTRRGWVVSSTPGRTLTPGKTRFPFYRRLGGPQGRSGRAENLVPTGIRSRTVQPIVIRYTDWATRPTYNWYILC